MSITAALHEATKIQPTIPDRDQAKIAVRHLYREASFNIGLLTNRHCGAEGDGWKLDRLQTGLALAAAARLIQGLYGITQLDIEGKMRKTNDK